MEVLREEKPWQTFSVKTLTGAKGVEDEEDEEAEAHLQGGRQQWPLSVTWAWEGSRGSGTRTDCSLRKLMMTAYHFCSCMPTRPSHWVSAICNPHALVLAPPC